MLIIGLDNAGKTTLLYRMSNQSKPTLHTIATNHEVFTYLLARIDATDIGGNDKIMQIWNMFYPEVGIFVYAINSTDTGRILENKGHIHRFVKELGSQKAVLLFAATKSDQNNAMPISQLIQELELNSIQSILWHIQPMNALSGDGIKEGMTWALNEYRKLNI